MWELEDILHYNMNPDEAKAFKIALMWQDLSRQEFPNYQHSRLRKSGDPRKSLLFKYCYKLVQETKGLIPDHEYRLYVLAQLHILKYVATTKEHGLIDPIILVGDKAWKRWKIWKKKYDQKYRENITTSVDQQVTASSSIVSNELKRTKKFLIEKFKTIPTFEHVKKSIQDLSMIRWVSLGRVSPYYVLLSPFVGKCLSGKTFIEVFFFDLSVYDKSISQDVKMFFRQEFANEF
jgi:hypothetical protein